MSAHGQEQTFAPVRISSKRGNSLVLVDPANFGSNGGNGSIAAVLLEKCPL
jgi:hypothetical protein